MENKKTSDLYFKAIEEVPFSQIRTECIENPNLSWKAKGILIYILSRSEHWKVRYKDLVKRSTGGETSLKSGLKELKEKGFLYRRVKFENGKIAQNGYLVFSVARPLEEAKALVDPDEEGWKILITKYDKTDMLR